METELPSGGAVGRAFDLADAALLAPIRNHSVRVALYARAIAEREGSILDHDLAMVAGLLHDLGTAVSVDEPLRFEVTGAAAAAKFVRAERAFADAEADDVWDAVALHTSPQIAELRGGLTRVLRLAVRADFGDDSIASLRPLRECAEQSWPRHDIEDVLSSTVVAHALETTEKAPGPSWARDLVAAHLADPGRVGANPAF